ncbi:hypothetical protein B0A79_15450 [Flavobacterium piscis]|uniref:Uncharacterized protein n=1 Tax=Flavobacterium piscis TaxID=1114874 RepID=A0ABX2XPK8_9FLAO|nr:hypothetical protein [Flavobacterium piscis]OCB78202.1 hypothetical protein FLP_00405 [Flavobacterium piscis]OXG02345.1 hypothetical protein B0A79_15450 [Flavobacterium piscis]
MKNSNNKSYDQLKKCPYHVSVYGEKSCELIYTTKYKGDWGDWDEAPNKSSKSKPKENGTKNSKA